MLKKIVTTLMAGLISLGSISTTTLAVNVGQGTFGDPTSTTSVGVAGTGEDQKEGFLEVVKGFVNWILGILALISLIILLWGGFQMVTAAGDDNKYKNGFKILKQAAIGLILIGVAWFIVSLIFTVIGAVTGTSDSSTS